MEILITCLSFRSYTGSEIYFYELSKQLVKRGHKVTILSQMQGGDMYKRASNNGVKCYDFTMAPKKKYDVILASHTAVMQALFKNSHYKDTPIVQVCHSEVLQQEEPYIHKDIKHYIAIRPAIQKMLEEKFYIEPQRISLIYNPVNDHKFTYIEKQEPKEKTMLFIGTIDALRANMLNDLVKRSVTDKYKLIVVGQKIYLPCVEMLERNNVQILPPDWHVEKYYAKASLTASIMLGRTTIEGWYYGLPCYIYRINKEGELQGMEIVEAPKDLSIFSAQKIAEQVEQVLKQVVEQNIVKA